MEEGSGRLRRFLPHLQGASGATLHNDVLAGVTVAALAVPQGMAYALVAGVPAEMGLLAAALPAVAAALFGSSRCLVSGPTNPIALLVGISIVGPAVAAGRPVPVETVLATGMLAGLLLAAFAIFRFGRASRFLSDSVISGFALGVGVLIALRQLPAVAGVEWAPSASHALVPRVWPLLWDGGAALLSADLRTLGLALGVPLSVVALRRLDPRWPGALLALAAAGVLSALLGWDEGPHALRSVESVTVGWPTWQVPLLLDPGTIGAPALAIALLVTVQSTAAARTLADSERDRLDPDRELFAQGMANLTASCVGALPASGSLTRSALARSAGARSRLAPALSGLIIALLLPVLAPLLVRVPLGALAGLVALSGLDLVNSKALRRASATRGDALVLGVTLAATLWIDLVQAVYTGLFLSLALLVRRSGKLHMVEIVRDGAQRLREIALDERTGTTPAVILHLEGDLSFAVAPALHERLSAIAARGPRVLILRLKRARHLDATALEVLRRVFTELRERDAAFFLCGITDPMAVLLERTELGRELGAQGLLRAGPRLFEGFERARDQARALLRPLSDEEIFRSESPGPWSYEI